MPLRGEVLALKLLRREQVRFAVKLAYKRDPRHLSVAIHTAMLAFHGRHQGQQAICRLPLGFIFEQLPQGFRGRVETAVMANLIQIYARQKRLIPLLAECVLPVLVLRIAWEEKLLLANLEKQNYAGVVHFLIKRAHDLEQLLATYRARMMDQPARVDAM